MAVNPIKQISFCVRSFGVDSWHFARCSLCILGLVLHPTKKSFLGVVAFHAKFLRGVHLLWGVGLPGYHQLVHVMTSMPLVSAGAVVVRAT